MVPHLNVDLMHGLSDADFAKIAQANSFLQMQSFGGGIDLPADAPEVNAPNLVDSASLQTGAPSTARTA